MAEKEQMMRLERQNYFSKKWEKTMSAHYYKSLDTKSNSIKIREKRRLVNKNIILELKKSEENPARNMNKIKIIENLSRFLEP